MTKNIITEDARFNTVHHDPRFIKPNKKKIRGELETKDKDDRFQNLSKKSSFKKVPNFKLVDYARARVVLESSDDEEDQNTGSESELDSESDLEDQIVQLGPGSSSYKHEKTQPEIDLNEELVEEEQPANQIEPTKRIGIVNLDWDNVKPIDIYKVFSSLLSPNHHHQHDPAELPLGKTHCDPKQDDQQPKKTSLDTSNNIVEGQVVRVRFYKSQFGKERMAIEDVEGPPKEIFKKPAKDTSLIDQQPSDQGGENDDDDDDDDDDEWLKNEDRGDEFDAEALRKYQIDRLRYYYAIVELDSVRTAHHVFTQIDGTEFERTANMFDLSYVPDDMTFDEDDLWDECVEDSKDYKGVDFSTDVLRHSKVKLTWDSEDPIRTKYTRLNTQKLKQEELDSMDFKHFLAPPSSEEDNEESETEDVGGRVEKTNLLNPTRSKNIRQLLGLTSDAQLDQQPPSADGAYSNQHQGELDITFKPGFIDLNQDLDETKLDYQPKGGKTKNQKIKKKLKSKQVLEDQSIMLNQEEDVSEKKKEKKKNQKDKTKPLDSNPQAPDTQGRQELELLMMEEGGEGGDQKQGEKNHFDLNQIIKSEKHKNKKRNNNKHKKSAACRRLDDDCDDNDQFVDTFSIDPTDQRFDRYLVDHPEFAIDPSNPQFKKTRSMMDLLNSTGQKRRAKGRHEGREEEPLPKSPHPELKPPEADARRDETRLLLNKIKKNASSSFKRPKLV